MSLGSLVVGCAVLGASPLLAQIEGNITIEPVAMGYRFTEGPAWSPEDFLIFSDTVTGQLRKYTPGKGVSDLSTIAGGVSGNTYDSKGNLYTCEFRARRVMRTDKKGKAEVVAGRFEGKRLNAPNDVVVRKDGNVYFTDPAFGNQQDAKELDFYGVFRVSPRGELTAVARWKTRPNGIALSADGKLLFVSNSDEQTVHTFDLDRAGAASNDRVVISKIDGAPGGVRTDSDGRIYVAAREVSIYSARGELLRSIHFGEQPSNLTFGDVDLGTLYVTAHTSIYRVKLGVKGTVSYLP